MRLQGKFIYSKAFLDSLLLGGIQQDENINLFFTNVTEFIVSSESLNLHEYKTRKFTSFYNEKRNINVQ